MIDRRLHFVEQAASPCSTAGHTPNGDCRTSQPKVRSITQRRGSTLKSGFVTIMGFAGRAASGSPEP
jgi:hypothetical protein